MPISHIPAVSVSYAQSGDRRLIKKIMQRISEVSDIALLTM